MRYLATFFLDYNSLSTKPKYRWFTTRNRVILLFNYFLSLFYLVYQLIYISFYSRKFLNQAFIDINQSKGEMEFSRGIKNRLRQYTIFHGFLAFLMCNIYGRGPNKSELNRFIYLSICAPLFDDLIDFWKLSPKEISKFLKGEKIDRMPELATKMALKYLHLITDGFEKKQSTQFEYLIEKLIKEQSNADSKNKGATAALLYRSLIDESLSTQESKYLKQLGNLGQYIDDIFDYPKDKSSGINTWAQQFPLSSLNSAYRTEMKQLLILMQDYQDELGASYDNQSRWILITLLSTPFVALSYFKNHSNKIGEIDPNHQVCDMELNTNRISLLRKAWKLGNSSL